MGLEEKLKEVEEKVANKESKKDINKGLLWVFIFVLFVSLMTYTCVSLIP
jgi:hypothetical protein